MLRISRIAVAGCLLLSASIASADTYWIVSGAPGNLGLKTDNIRIQSIEGGKLIYLNPDGSRRDKEMSRIALIAADDNPTFTSAEKAFFEGNFEDASELYSKVISSSDKDWMKLRSASQLEKATARSNRFDLKTVAWVQAVVSAANPGEITRPQLPAADSKYLELAADKISETLNNAKISENQQSTLLLFLLDIYQLKKDPRQNEIRQRLDHLTSTSTTVNTSARAGLVLSNVHAAMDAGKYEKVMTDIQSNKAVFTEPEQQVDALYCLAEAHNALAKQSADANVLKDVGLAYMRVVAHAKDLAVKPPFVADALYKTALIHERLKEPQTATTIYRQIIEQFPESPAAGHAKERVAALNNKTPQP